MKRAFGSQANRHVVWGPVAGYSAAAAKDHPSRSRRQRTMSGKYSPTSCGAFERRHRWWLQALAGH